MNRIVILFIFFFSLEEIISKKIIPLYDENDENEFRLVGSFMGKFDKLLEYQALKRNAKEKSFSYELISSMNTKYILPSLTQSTKKRLKC